MRIDTGMVTKHIDQSHGGTPQQYADDLVAEIKVRRTCVPFLWASTLPRARIYSIRAMSPIADGLVQVRRGILARVLVHHGTALHARRAELEPWGAARARAHGVRAARG